ncbi:MAG: hypothetical protein AAF458_01100 [Pseudomonadota bacterium]
MSSDRFGYLIEKIVRADFTEEPFRHIYLEDFFTEQDFTEVCAAKENALPPAADDAALLDSMFESGYQIIEFPGCITDKNAYLEWRHRGAGDVQAHTACEGFGMTLRLTRPHSPILTELKSFLESEALGAALAAKFAVTVDDCTFDTGIQKYLDGYEISPHPDVRRKALTFMVNINPHENSEQLDHHTHYMRFRTQRAYVKAFWDGNPAIDRCWVPWDWCETVSVQRRNNSIVVFAPSNETMHAVRASYDHLGGQRTQLYGNLWYKTSEMDGVIEWEQFDLRPPIARPISKRQSLLRALGRRLPSPVKSKLKRLIRRS